MGVQPSIIDALKKKCVYCKQNGAGLVCEKCEKTMHYECVIDKCKFDGKHISFNAMNALTYRRSVKWKVKIK